MKKLNLLWILALVPIVTFADTEWTTGQYSNNANISKTLSIPSAEMITVKISGTTEKNYDFITIKDQNDNQVGKFSGLINETLQVESSAITATLTSDYSVTKSGVTVTIEDAIAPVEVIKWSTGAYKNNERRSYKMAIPDGFCTSQSPNGYCVITINGETEKNYDFIMISDDKGQKLGSFTGTIEGYTTLNEGYNAKFITVTLISDGSITKSGATITIEGGVQFTP